MRLLNQGDAEALLELLIRDLPRQVLEAVARAGGRREAQLVSDLARWLPRSVATGEVRGWVSDTLDWFVARGDIGKGFGGRYHCAPPYVLAGIDDADDRPLWLCGDPRVEGSLRDVLQAENAVLIHRAVPAGAAVEERLDTGELSPPIGVERLISSPRALRTQVTRECERAGIVVVRPSHMTIALPRLADVLVPAERDLQHLPTSAGVWDVYDPQITEDDRWTPSPDWRAAQARLIRWRPSDDWRAQRSARIFYHAAHGRVAELGPEAASLWQLYLDAEANCYRSAWWDGGRMWVPRIIPAATQQCLRVIAGRSAYFRAGWLVLEMGQAVASSASATLEETLSLRCEEGQPPAATGRRGRSKRRSAE